MAAALCWAVSVDGMGGVGSGASSSAMGTHLSKGMRMSMGLGLRTNLGSLGWFIGMRATMMAAMMLPNFEPNPEGGTTFRLLLPINDDA